MAAADAAWVVRSAVRAFRRREPWPDGPPGGPEDVCVALSGGADSLALTAAACAEYRSVTALVVDHGLQAGSAQVAQDAAGQARQLGARALVLTVEVGGTGGEADAREARYAALEAAREGRPVLLAHTLDDQAETVVLALARGSGTRSLRGMAPWRGPWGRPLLGVRAGQTRAACRELGLEPWEDPHNTDPAYARVRVRREVLPLLEEVLGGGVATGLARTARLARAADDALESLASDALSSDAAEGPGAAEPEELTVSLLEPLPEAVRARVVHRWLVSRGVPAPTSVHVEAVTALVTEWSGQGGVAVGGTAGERGAAARLVVRREHGKLCTQWQDARGGDSAATSGSGDPNDRHR